MKKFLLLPFPLLWTATVLAQGDSAGGAGEGGISFRTIMNIVFGVLALALLAIGIWYFKLKKENE